MIARSMLLLALTLVLELSPQRWSSPGGSEALSLLLADLAVTAALLLAGWVLLCAAVGAAARLPGGLGRAARRLLAVLLPRTMRVLVLGAVGWQVVGPVPAAALDTAPAVERPRTSAPAFLTPAVETPRHDSSSVEAAPVEVVVAPGDSLWSIAQRHLRPGSSTAEVAAAWPGWYAANQRVIGSDPDLLQVGVALVAPEPTGAPA